MGMLDYASRGISSDSLYAISRIVNQSSEWKPALDQIAPLVREIFIFDNLAVYQYSTESRIMEVLYARAVGRGRKEEADIAWGESVANRVMESHTVVQEEPDANSTISRLQRPYLLGIPLKVGQRFHGALVFIRFGGPIFLREHVQLAEFIANQIALLIEKEGVENEYHALQDRHRQSQLQEDFVSMITHDLRNPLGFIKGYTTTLLRSDTTWDEATQREFLTIIDQEADQLQELIENLLDSARLQSGQLNMNFQAVRLDAVMNDVIMRAKMHYPDLEISWKGEIPAEPIQGNPRRLAQVFENLISNAVKYAPGSDVLITIDQNEYGVTITVEDHGRGISQEYVTELFKRFYRAPDQPPNIRGSGLGLYICRQIIQAHNGQISVTSTVGQGTQFHIFLPSRP
jgi:signal transduction histidine kinase